MEATSGIEPEYTVLQFYLSRSRPIPSRIIKYDFVGFLSPRRRHSYHLITHYTWLSGGIHGGSSPLILINLPATEWKWILQARMTRLDARRRSCRSYLRRHPAGAWICSPFSTPH